MFKLIILLTSKLEILTKIFSFSNNFIFSIIFLISVVSLLVSGSVKFKGGSIKIEEGFQDKFTKVDGEYVFPINGGTIEMKENKVIILAD